MQKLFELDLKKEEIKSKIVNERQYVISLFLEALNKEREGTKYKPLTGRTLAIKLSLLKTNKELYEFLSECRDYRNRKGSFGKRFFGGYKQNEKENNN